MDVPAVDVMELFNTNLTGNDLRNTLGGMALMVGAVGAFCNPKDCRSTGWCSRTATWCASCTA